MIQVLDKQFDILYDESEVQHMVDRVAAEITRDLGDKNPLFLPVLNGAFMFASDLMKRFDFPCEISFIKYSSYSGMQTTGELKSIIGIPESVKGRHVVVVEDIVDTGFTMKSLLDCLKNYGAASVHVATLLTKEGSLQMPVRIDYVAKEVPNLFVVGYGLDYDGYGRNYPAIYHLSE